MSISIYIYREGRCARVVLFSLIYYSIIDIRLRRGGNKSFFLCVCVAAKELEEVVVAKGRTMNALLDSGRVH